MRKSLFVLIAVCLVTAVPIFGSCTPQMVGGVPGWYQCITSSNWTGAPSANVVTYHPSETMCNSFWTDFFKSVGAYGYAEITYSFTTETDPNLTGYVDIGATVDLKNSHTSSLNRMGIIVYNDTDSTVETIDTIDGSSGDICTHTYSYHLYRPQWTGKAIRVLFEELYWDNDAQFNVSAASYIQNTF